MTHIIIHSIIPWTPTRKFRDYILNLKGPLLTLLSSLSLLVPDTHSQSCTVQWLTFIRLMCSALVERHRLHIACLCTLRYLFPTPTPTPMLISWRRFPNNLKPKSIPWRLAFPISMGFIRYTSSWLYSPERSIDGQQRLLWPINIHFSNLRFRIDLPRI